MSSEQLEQVIADRRRERLHDKDALFAHALAQVDIETVVGKMPRDGGQQGNLDVIADLLRQLGVRAPAKNTDIVHR